jgi:squalene cyclase
MVTDAAVLSKISDLSVDDSLTASQVLVLARNSQRVRGAIGPRLSSLTQMLIRTQEQDGHWERKGDDWHTSITAWALLALHGHTMTRLRAQQKGIDWIAGRQRLDGGFRQSDQISAANAYCTAYATAALYESCGVTGAVVRGAKWLARAQGQEGGFLETYSKEYVPDCSVTAYVIHALSRLPSAVYGDVVSRGLNFIATQQDPCGSWPVWYGEESSVEGTAAALRALMRSPSQYRKEILRGMDFLHATVVDCGKLEGWVLVSLAYVVLWMDEYAAD